MNYNKLLDKINECLFWLDANARYAIELKETFTFPAYDTSIRKLVEGTKKIRCYEVCLNAVYYEFVLTLMRMYDKYQNNTFCFINLFDYLSDDFINNFEKNMQREVRTEIKKALNEFNYLNNSHLLARLQKVRNKMLAHTSTDFTRNQIAKYGDAEALLEKTLPMLNRLNLAISGRKEPYNEVSKYWNNYAIEFWSSLIKDN